MRLKKDNSKADHKSGPLDNQKWEAFARYSANGETQAEHREEIRALVLQGATIDSLPGHVLSVENQCRRTHTTWAERTAHRGCIVGSVAPGVARPERAV